MITIKELNKVYEHHGKPFDALKNINLTISPGEIFGVLGKSGAGKSTLLRCVNLLEIPSSGSISLEGTDLTSLSLEKLRETRHKMGMIFQHFNLLESRNVFDNIALPLEIMGKSKEVIREKVSTLLSLVDLEARKNYMPSQLSGGQKQRVAIARALATDPHILLSDEATSALDTNTTISILSLLKKINKELGVTILLITHELEVVKQICDRVAVLEEGELVETGKTIEVLLNPKTTAAKKLVQQKLHFISSTTTPNIRLVKLTFIGESSDEPLISTLAKKFNISINIKQAQIEKIQDIMVGFTLCELKGDPTELEHALTYIQSTNVKAEILTHE